MSWSASAGVAALTAIAGLVVSGFIASLCVSWYRVSSFEGGAGYFVVGLALLGGIAGFVIGLVVARWVAAQAGPGFLPALGIACGVVVALGILVAVPARLLADVPPEIDGEELFIAFELKWPRGETDPRTLSGMGTATLGSVVMHTQRKSEDGPLFVEDAHEEDGRWVVPGAVRIFTGRGDRSLSARIGDKQLPGFILPIGSRPTDGQRQWSEWLPRARDGAPPLPDGFRYRFRVIKQSEPMRMQHVGPFDVATRANYFFTTQDNPRLAAYSYFAISHRGRPVEALQRARYVSVVTGAVPALLVHDGQDDQSGNCLLLVEQDSQLKTLPAGECVAPVVPHLLTRDQDAFVAHSATTPTRGWLDRESLARPALYRIDHAVIDTRAMTVTPFELPSEPFPQADPGLIGLSPDEKSVVWFAFGGSDESPLLGVTNYHDQRSYSLPIDRTRMRYSEYTQLDPAWVDHHFTWVRDVSGSDSLVERPHFEPLPHRGELQLGRAGDYAGYYLKPGSLALRAAMSEFLSMELGGTRQPDELDGHTHVVTFGDQRVELSFVESGDFVSISMYKSDEALMRRIAEAVDKALATGRYDALFGKTE